MKVPIWSIKRLLNSKLTHCAADPGGTGNDHHHHNHHHSFSRVNSCVGPAAAAAGRNSLVEWNHKEITALVKKSWKSSHVECSATYNWNVVSVFKELAVTLTAIANGQVIGSQSSGNTSRKKRCLMF